MNCKSFAAVLLTLALLLSLCACGAQAPEADGHTELTVFAAASLTETLTALGKTYTDAHPEVALTFNFDSSGTLQTQIEEGADCDVFVSAAPKQMDALQSGGYLLPEGRFDLLENRVALIAADSSPADIGSFDELALALQDGGVLLAMGSGDVPAGQYAQKIFAYYGLDEASLSAAGCITYASNVKEITTQVSEGIVDCGIVYASDAVSAELTAVDFASETMCGQVIYPAAVLNISAHAGEAQAFLDYLRSGEAGAVFESVGLTPLG